MTWAISFGSTRIFRRLPRLALASVAATLWLGDLQGKTSASGDPALQRAIDKVFPALVRIFVLTDEPGGGRLEKMTSAGSGVIISDEGYIITNHHVAGKARHLICRMADGEEIEAKLIGTDALSDIAIIKLNLSQRKKKGKLAVAAFGDSDRMRVGDTVLAMGSPMAVSQSVTKGIVSNTSLMTPSLTWWSTFRLDGESVGSLVRWLGHDAVIYGGNSGGPLVNMDGKIVGINEVGLGSLGGAIPSNLARSVAEQLIKKGYVERSWTGIEGQPRPKSLSDGKGVLVAGVIAGSPADEGGLRSGDLITKFDGVEADARIQEDLPLFNALVMSTPIGKRISLEVLRDGQPKKLQLTTRVRGRAVDRDVEVKDWGMTCRNFTMLSAIERRRDDTNGVEVTSLDMTGAAAAAVPPLEPGDVVVALDGQAVRSVADLKRITAALTKEATDVRSVLVTFERGVSQYLTLAKIGRHETPPEESPRKPGLQMILQPVGTELADALGVKQGVRVAFVYPNRAAAKAGIRAGDILTRFDGDSIRGSQAEDVGQLLSRVRKYKVGSEVELDLLRGKEARKVTMRLEADGPLREELKKYKDRNFELTVREMPEMERVKERIPEDLKGVRVEEVMASGWASLAHVMVGDILLEVDGKPSPDVETAEKLFKAAAERKARRIMLFLRRGVHTMFVELEPNWDSIASDRRDEATR